jgi:hypothetical protein
MYTRTKKLLASVLVLLNLGITAAPHVGHPDEFVGSGGTATLCSHTCGANEIHRDIKDHRDCLLCSRTTHFVAFVVLGAISASTTREFIAFPDTESSTSFEPTLSFFLRGPPVLVS